MKEPCLKNETVDRLTHITLEGIVYKVEVKEKMTIGCQLSTTLSTEDEEEESLAVVDEELEGEGLESQDSGEKEWEDVEYQENID